MTCSDPARAEPGGRSWVWQTLHTVECVQICVGFSEGAVVGRRADVLPGTSRKIAPSLNLIAAAPARPLDRGLAAVAQDARNPEWRVGDNNCAVGASVSEKPAV